MNTETALLLGWLAGTVSTFVGLASYARIIAPAKAGGWRPLKVGRLESSAEQVAVISRDVPPVRSSVPPREVYPSATVYNSASSAPRTQEAYRFHVAAPDGSTHVVLLPARYITRFISLDEIKRDAWVGKATVYTDCLRVAQSRGWIQPHELRQNAYQWTREMSTLGRRISRLSDESIHLPSPGRA